MEKKNLKWYEAPEMELVDVKLQGMLCMSSGGHLDNDDDATGGNGGYIGF